MPSRPAFVSAAPVRPGGCRAVSAPRATGFARRAEPRAHVTTVSDRQLADLAAAPGVVVLKCFAKYCPGCRGVEPKFRKIAAAYQHAAAERGSGSVAFCQIDYARYEAFCKESLGVQALPFFGIWSDGKYVGGEPMGWNSVGKRLVEKIDSVLNQ